MHYDVLKNDHGLPHDPFKAIVAPRPIGWISAMDKQGRLNLSPYSFFNGVSDRPHMVGFASDGRKDALAFIEETGEFTCSMATYALREAMNKTSASLPRGESEFEFAGLETAPSMFVKPPRVKASPAALECKWLQTVPLKPLEGGPERYYWVIGQVVGIYLDEACLKDGLLDTAAMQPIARGGYMDYFVATQETKFSIKRPG